MEIVIGVVLILITLLLLLVILVGIFYFIDLFLDLPYVATQKHKIETIIKLAQIKKGETVVDLGSGDGRLLFASAQKGAKAVGYELNPFLIALTLIHTKLKGLGNEVWIERKSLWRADLKVADVIFVYSLKKTIKKFEDFVFQKKYIRSVNGIYLYKI
ncbi:MAG: hypothetical protein UT84_C0059G0009 [Candidatus Curtissbacteria bacterium GW2011_GWA1_40_16]|uniref:Methyltransferase domain-containing protein n=1 Tax=Candidatus Curtissbacteria bacterium GW2011_GWA1_40_16 TaxID=1618405 RepID=A0A0G0R5M1_9BACT|nr:MAG: hypothetical protein UT84_C0059G0009 [Candidatus Curtissbacteria bacterium GW2011_GWA1_40_16]